MGHTPSTRQGPAQLLGRLWSLCAVLSSRRALWHRRSLTPAHPGKHRCSGAPAEAGKAGRGEVQGRAGWKSPQRPQQPREKGEGPVDPAAPPAPPRPAERPEATRTAAMLGLPKTASSARAGPSARGWRRGEHGLS